MIEKDKTILNYKESDYRGKFQDHLFEQYKLYVNSADKISDRRQKNNDFFLAINTALIAYLGYIGKEIGVNSYMLIITSLTGIAICYSWYRLVRSYKNINTGKFNVIHKIEKELPCSPYDIEWIELGEGKNKNKYLPFTHMELKIPWIFLVLYIFIIIFNFPWLKLLNIICKLLSIC